MFDLKYFNAAVEPLQKEVIQTTLFYELLNIVKFLINYFKQILNVNNLWEI